VVTPLVSDLSGKAKFQDQVLQNSWGVAFSPAGSPFWINDNNTGCSTLYDGTGVKQALQVSIPLPGNIVPPTDCQTVKPAPAPPPNPTPAAPTHHLEPVVGICRPRHKHPGRLHLRH
jgi:hypothetical protein